MSRLTMNLVLASQSPRRAELLRAAGFQFSVFAPEDSVEENCAKENVAKKWSPEVLVVALAVAKAEAVVAKLLERNSAAKNELREEDFLQTSKSATQSKSTIVLAADTVAHCRGEILEKPDSRADAKRMLRLMSGQLHEVLTGVCLWNLETNAHRELMERTTLRMDELSDDQLELFLDSGEWQGKAGAFGFQDGLDWVHIETGLASNVVGLPVERLEKIFLSIL